MRQTRTSPSHRSGPAICLSGALALWLSACTGSSPEIGQCKSELAWNNAMTFNAMTFNAVSYNGVEFRSLAFEGGRLSSLGLWGPSSQPRSASDRDETTLVAATDRGEALELEVADTQRRDGRLWSRLELGGQALCADDGFGIFVPGVWDLESGARQDAIEVEGRGFDATYSCPGGVIAKCVLWGYDPDAAGADLHQTCTRMARADYCGDGTSYTENGTTIDVYDAAGLVAPETERPPDFEFEAGWGPSGAVCTNKPRYHDEVVGVGPVLPHCWSDLPSCSTFTEAEEQGASLGNHSGFAERSLCEPPRKL